MRSAFLTLILAQTMGVLNAQIHAITDTGDEVILYEDQTWKYVNDSIGLLKEILLSEANFTRDKNSTFLVKSSEINVGIYIDPSKWEFSKGAENEAADFQFRKKGDDLHALMIAEKVEIPVENLRDIAIKNARNAAPDLEVLHQEFRNVNGKKVLMMQMVGTIQGIKFIYFGYYYSNSQGSIQLLTYTARSLLEDYRNDIELFLNGFTELE
jgi:hypothetical protein